MSEFPELDGYEAPAGAGFSEFSEQDLASREKEILGEDVAAELAANAPATADADEFSDSEFVAAPVPASTEPTLYDDASAADEPASGATALLPSSKPGAGPSAYVPENVDLSNSEFLKEWATKRDLEIERRDKYSKETLEATQEKAHKAIDDFYENYNGKKEKEIAVVREEAAEFEKKRDADIGGGTGTTWALAAQLVEGLNKTAEGVQPADKKRFLQLLGSLKDDAKAPGAAGY